MRNKSAQCKIDDLNYDVTIIYISRARLSKQCHTTKSHSHRHMFDLACCEYWHAKTKNFLFKKWRLNNSRKSTPFKSSRYSTFSERFQEIPRKSQLSVKTIRLSENSFVHDFSDFSDPERKLSYAREIAHSDSDEEIYGRYVVVSICAIL
jgi:hypothetical protein